MQPNVQQLGPSGHLDPASFSAQKERGLLAILAGLLDCMERMMTCSQMTPVAVPSSSFFMLAVRVLSFDDSAVSGELPEQLMLPQQHTVSAMRGKTFLRTTEKISCRKQFASCWTLLHFLLRTDCSSSRNVDCRQSRSFIISLPRAYCSTAVPACGRPEAAADLAASWEGGPDPILCVCCQAYVRPAVAHVCPEPVGLYMSAGPTRGQPFSPAHDMSSALAAGQSLRQCQVRMEAWLAGLQAATNSRGSHVPQVYLTSSELVGTAGMGAAAELLQPTLACAVAEFLATLPAAGMWWPWQSSAWQCSLFIKYSIVAKVKEAAHVLLSNPLSGAILFDRK